MTGRSARDPRLKWRILLFAIIGGAIALVLGLAAVALAPDDGFADLAAASLTKIFLIPTGIVAGAVVGWRTSPRR